MSKSPQMTHMLSCASDLHSGLKFLSEVCFSGKYSVTERCRVIGINGTFLSYTKSIIEFPR